MRVTMQADPLRRALDRLDPALAPKTTPSPALRHVRIRLDEPDGPALLVLTNLDLAIAAAVPQPDGSPGDPGEVLVDFATLRAVARACGAAPVEVECGRRAKAAPLKWTDQPGREVAVRAGAFRSFLPGPPPALHPVAGVPVADDCLRLPASSLARLLSRAVGSADRDHAAGARRGLRIFAGSGGAPYLCAVALSGAGVAIAREPADPTAASLPGGLEAVTFPARAALAMADACADAAAAAKLAGLPDPEARLGFACRARGGADFAWLAAGNVVVRARMLEGRFPRHEPLIPRGHDDPPLARFRLDSDAALATALDLAAACATENSPGVELEYTPAAGVRLWAEAADAGRSLVRFDGGPDGDAEPVWATLDARLVKQALAAASVAGGQEGSPAGVVLEVRAGDAPVVVRSADGLFIAAINTMVSARRPMSPELAGQFEEVVA
jgi:hypothetical protein